MSAKDWHSLPVPPVVGMAIKRQHGQLCFADAPVIFHLTAVGQDEVAALGGVHAAAAPQTNNRVDAQQPRHFDAAINTSGRRIFLDLIKADDLHALPFEQGDDPAGMARGNDARVGDQQDFFDGKFRRQFVRLARPRLIPKTNRVRG